MAWVAEVQHESPLSQNRRGVEALAVCVVVSYGSSVFPVRVCPCFLSSPRHYTGITAEYLLGYRVVTDPDEVRGLPGATPVPPGSWGANGRVDQGSAKEYTRHRLRAKLAELKQIAPVLDGNHWFPGWFGTNGSNLHSHPQPSSRGVRQ